MKKVKKYAIIAGISLSTLLGSGFTLLHFSITKAYSQQDYSQTLTYLNIARYITSYYQDIHDDVLFSSAVKHSQQEYSWPTNSKSTTYRKIVTSWKKNIIDNKKKISDTRYKQLYDVLLEPNHNHPYALSMPKIHSHYYTTTIFEEKEYTALKKAIQLANTLPSKEAEQFKTICAVEIINMYFTSFNEIYLTLYPNILLAHKENFTHLEHPMLHPKVFKTKNHTQQLQTSLNKYMHLFKEESEELLTQLSEKQKYVYSYTVNYEINQLIFLSTKVIPYCFKDQAPLPLMETIAALYTLTQDLDKRYSFKKSFYHTLSEKQYLETFSKMNFRKIQQYLAK